LTTVVPAAAESGAVSALVDSLEEHGDVREVYSNAEILE
jgi:transcriptional/translational regulatory protein YebC/TACO1